MPFIKYNGEAIYFDTLEEAKAAIDGKQAGSKGTSGGAGPWTQGRFKDYIARLSAPQVKILQELVKSPSGVKTAKDLASAGGLSGPKAFGPVMAALSKHAKRAGISFDNVLKSERKDIGGEEMLVFTASPAFMKTSAEAGWSVSEE
jgi:hypothetical protein